MNERIIICVCTRRRPKLLRECLHSLGQLIRPYGFDVKLLVIDNNNEKSRDVSDACDAFKARYRFEPSPGLSFARNAALMTALAWGADWIAFIDDDERAQEDWLLEFTNAIHRFSHLSNETFTCGSCGYTHRKPGRAVDAAHGVTRYKFPDDASKWRCRNPWGSWGTVDGAELDCASTGNVIFRADIIRRAGLRFEPGQNTSGGEDTKFFYEFHKVGGRIILATQAIVTETVTWDRLTLRGHWRKAFRNGVHKVEFKQMKRPRVIKRALRRGVMGVLKMALAPVNRRAFLSGWLNVAESSGIITALCGGSYNYYRETTGE